MNLALASECRPAFEQRPTPALIAYATLLVSSADDVERLVERELATNPALEREDACAPAMPGAAPPAAPREPADEPGLLERLAVEARLTLPTRDHPALDFVLGSLDDHGFLTMGPPDIARAVGAPAARVEAVISLVRELAPVGVASRDVRECIDAQLRLLDADVALVELARRVVAGGFADLAAGRYGALARRLAVDRSRVVAARDLIRLRTTPYPVLDCPIRRAADPTAAVPEIVITPSLSVHLLEEQRIALRVSPAYEALLPGDDDCRRARTFVRRLGERWSTIRRVAEHTVAEQRGFVLEGPAALRPLTRGQVATALGLHESTVSRAVAGRSALLPCGRVVKLGAFFTASLSAQEALRMLVAREAHPLSDDELAVALATRGHRVARRTVAKYRALLDIPPSSRRSGEARFASSDARANRASHLAAAGR